MRFVPLATEAGSPANISAGIVTRLPPPATVLTKPATSPATIRMASCPAVGSSITRSRCSVTRCRPGGRGSPR